MKKIKYLIFAMIMLFVGCTTNNNDSQQENKESGQTSKVETTTETTTPMETTTEELTTTVPEPTETALAIRAVLKNERPFLDANNGYKEVYKDDYSYFQGNNNANIGWWTFTMLDIGNDGKREVKITVRNLKYDGNKVDINDTTRMIFRYYNGQVYGYQCSKIVSLRNDEYFIWDSVYLHQVDNLEYNGGGKIEFDGEKIKYIFYVSEGNKIQKEWLENILNDENIEIIEDSQKNEFAIQKCDDKNIYDTGDSNLNEDIDKYIY